MFFKAKPMVAALFVAGTLVLSGCNDDNTQAQQSETPELSAEQQDIAKYNAFIEVANGARFAETLISYQKYYAEKIQKKKPLTDYSVVSPYNIKMTRENLDKALALTGNLPELDATAKPLNDALVKLEPINAELNNYAESKGYLSDKGKKAQEKDAEYIAALTDVVKAQEAFLDAISKRDEINTRTAFEKAEKDSVDYYRAGIVLYAKQAANRSQDFFESAGEQKTADAFNESLDKLNEMADGWNKKMSETHAKGCTNLVMQVNSLLSSGRDAIAHAARGDYKRKTAYMTPTYFDEQAVSQGFNNVINSLNQQQC